jgi:predicted TIM-barrel enzyme
MAVFVLLAMEGPAYVPPACTTPVFSDVPAADPFCRWIEELARRGVVSGCGGGAFCPSAAVTREQMSVFLLRTLDPALNPPACTTPVFGDVPAGSPFCRWIEELARRGITAGCGGGNYCPTAANTRGQMAVFVTTGFSLKLYEP